MNMRDYAFKAMKMYGEEAVELVDSIESFHNKHECVDFLIDVFSNCIGLITKHEAYKCIKKSFENTSEYTDMKKKAEMFDQIMKNGWCGNNEK